MHALAQWEQSPTFDPYNPNQIIRERYVGIPGGYGSFYFNKQPTTVNQVLGGLGAGFSGLPAWGQALIVGSLAATAGYLAWGRHISCRYVHGLQDKSRSREKGQSTRG
jgi:hypothetical protein